MWWWSVRRRVGWRISVDRWEGRGAGIALVWGEREREEVETEIEWSGEEVEWSGGRVEMLKSP